MTSVATRRRHLPPATTTAREQAGPVDDVELNSDESFPASDPPSWTPVARVGQPKKVSQSGHLSHGN
jgi:hypothetical protein